MTFLSSMQPGFRRNPVAIPIGSLGLVASTDLPGFALVNGTPVILSWTAPNDGNMHRVIAFTSMHVTTLEVGGVISLNYVLPDGTPVGHTLLAGSVAAGDNSPQQNTLFVVVPPGATVSIQQSTALTGGAATLWAELWAS